MKYLQIAGNQESSFGEPEAVCSNAVRKAYIFQPEGLQTARPRYRREEARTLRELSETLVEFWDESEHQRDHEAFKKWQRHNNRGYVLNFPVHAILVFHKSGCPHIR